MWEMANEFVYGDTTLTIIFLMAITIGMIGLTAYQKGVMVGWSWNLRFVLAICWSLFVAADVVSGGAIVAETAVISADLFNGGTLGHKSLPQITSR